MARRIRLRILICVIALLQATLAHAVDPDGGPYGCNARCNAVKTVAAHQDIDVVGQALTLYRADHGRYPTQKEGLAALVGYIDRLPKDPWGHPYQYRNPGTHGPVDVFSAGAPGQSQAVGSWQ